MSFGKEQIFIDETFWDREKNRFETTRKPITEHFKRNYKPVGKESNYKEQYETSFLDPVDKQKGLRRSFTFGFGNRKHASKPKVEITEVTPVRKVSVKSPIVETPVVLKVPPLKKAAIVKDPFPIIKPRSFKQVTSSFDNKETLESFLSSTELKTCLKPSIAPRPLMYAQEGAFQPHKYFPVVHGVFVKEEERFSDEETKTKKSIYDKLQIDVPKNKNSTQRVRRLSASFTSHDMSRFSKTYTETIAAQLHDKSPGLYLIKGEYYLYVIKEGTETALYKLRPTDIKTIDFVSRMYALFGIQLAKLEVQEIITKCVTSFSISDPVILMVLKYGERKVNDQIKNKNGKAYEDYLYLKSQR